MSFIVETPPSTGVYVSFMSFTGACNDFLGGGEALEGGNRLRITSSGETTTLSFATDFTPFDTNEIGHLHFDPAAGEYDFCVKNLKFLDANGDEVTP